MVKDLHGDDEIVENTGQHTGKAAVYSTAERKYRCQDSSVLQRENTDLSIGDNYTVWCTGKICVWYFRNVVMIYPRQTKGMEH